MPGDRCVVSGLADGGDVLGAVVGGVVPGAGVGVVGVAVGGVRRWGAAIVPRAALVSAVVPAPIESATARPVIWRSGTIR